jgi:hypothetical protein
MLGAWFGPENYDVIGRLIFMEPDQDCDSVKPHSMYNDTIDYSTIGDFILYWDIVYGCPYQLKAAAAEKIGAKGLIVNFNDVIQFMPPMLTVNPDLIVSIPTIIIPLEDHLYMTAYAKEKYFLDEPVTAQLVAENGNIIFFFNFSYYFFGVISIIEAIASWICLIIAVRYHRRRNERLSFLIAGLQTTAGSVNNWADYWQSRNYWPREVNLVLWGVTNYLAFVELYWFFWIWYTVLIRGTIYRNRRQYRIGKLFAILGTVAQGLNDVVRYVLLCLGTTVAETTVVWRATLVPFCAIILILFGGLGFITFKLRSRLMASIKDMGTTGNKRTTESLNRVTKIGFPMIAILLAISWSLLLWLIKPDVFGVASLTTFMLCFRVAFVYIPVAHLWSILHRWRSEKISSTSSKTRSYLQNNSRSNQIATKTSANESAGKDSTDVASDNIEESTHEEDLKDNDGTALVTTETTEMRE